MAKLNNALNKMSIEMDGALEPERSQKGKWLPSLYVGPGVFVALYLVLGWFDNSTELSPSHDNVLQWCLVIAALSGLVAGATAVIITKGLPIWQRALTSFCFVLLGFLCIFMLSSRSADIIEGLIDFPSGKTQSFPALLLISRAYRTHGKEKSCNIQTTPVWSNLEISDNDYDFMLDHRRAGDHGRNPDEISSDGFFCAKVTIQQSGEAVRIMHAGNRKLPEGTVIVCPSVDSHYLRR